MRRNYEPKFNVMLKLKDGERWLMNADGSERGEHYKNDAHKLAKALIERGLAQNYRLVKLDEPKGLPAYQRQP